MTDVLITGSHGQLGRATADECRKRGLSFEGSDIDTLDISDPHEVERWIGEHRPRVLVNCAAYTAVDDCEKDEENARMINGEAVGHLAAACSRYGTRLVHVSTDYVFDGGGTRPYRETDEPAPVSAYGRTKLEGERRAAEAPDHLIVRTAWLYGRGGRNFVEAIRGQIEGGASTLRVVADQRGCPTFCDDLAEALLNLAASPARGVVHVVNSGETTWHGFACEIARLLGSEIPIEPVPTEAFPRPAPRPSYSVLDTTRLREILGRPMPSWQDALARYLRS